MALSVASTLILGVAGLDWGMSGMRLPYTTFHPDEYFAFVSGVKLLAGQPQPRFFYWGGTLHRTLMGAIVKAQGAVPESELLASQMRAFMIGRFVSVIAACAATLLVYFLGRELYGPREGALASALVALAPGWTLQSHQIRPEMLFCVGVVLAAIGSARMLRAARNSTGFWCGVAIGFAMSAKFNGVLCLVPAWFALASAGGPPILLPWRRKLVMAGGMLVVAAATFVILNPFCIVHWHHFTAFFAQMQRMDMVVAIDTVGRGPILFQYGGRVMRCILGLPFVVAFYPGLAALAWRPKREDVLVIMFVGIFMLPTPMSNFIAARYILPVVPFAALAVARALLLLAKAASALWRYAAAAILAIVMGGALVPSLAYVDLMSQPDTRAAAAEWIRQHIPPDQTVAVLRLSSLFYYPIHDRHDSQIIYHGGDTDNAPSSSTQSDAPVWVLSEVDFRQVERLGGRYPYRKSGKLIAALLGGQSVGDTRYRLIKEFRNDLKAFGLRVHRQSAPDDFMYVSPTIRIYAREERGGVREHN